MALQPLWLQEVDYPARWDRIIFDNIFDEGILGPSAFSVTQSSSPAMTVDVAAGVAIITGTDQAFQGKYMVREEAATTGVTIAAAPGSGQRNDIVVIQVRDTNAGGATGDDAIITVVQGTPSGSPVDPTLPASSYALARVRVPAGTGSINNALIDDLRTEATFAHPIVGSNSIIDGSITSSDIGTGEVATSNLADNSVTDGKLRDSIGVSVIGRSANSTGDPADIQAGTDGTVLRRSGGALGFAQVSSAEIATGAVTANELASNAVTEVKINAGAVTESKVATDAISTVKIQNSAVTNAKLATNAVATGNIQNSAVDANKLATNSVTNAKIANGAVSKSKIAASEIQFGTAVVSITGSPLLAIVFFPTPFSTTPNVVVSNGDYSVNGAILEVFSTSTTACTVIAASGGLPGTIRVNYVAYIP